MFLKMNFINIYLRKRKANAANAAIGYIKYGLLLLAFFIFVFQLKAQIVTDFSYSAKNVVVKNNQYHDNCICAEINFDLSIKTLKTPGSFQSFNFYPVIRTTDNKEISFSDNISQFKGFWDNDFHNNVATETSLKIYIPYRELTQLAGKTDAILELLVKCKGSETVSAGKYNILLVVPEVIFKKYNQQKFTVSSFLSDQDFSSFYKSDGLNISYSCLFQIPYDNIELNDGNDGAYCFYTVIKNNSGEIIFDGSAQKDIKILHPYYNTWMDNKPMDKISQFIPINKIKGDGEFTATIEINVRNKTGDIIFPKIFTKNIQIKKPIMVDYLSQVFTLSNVNYTEYHHSKGKNGLDFSLSCQMKYLSSQIREALLKPEYQDFYFVAELTDSLGRNIFLNKRDQLCSLPRKKVTNLKPDQLHDLDFYFPFRKMLLSEGSHLINLKIFVTDSANTLYFPVLYSKQIRIQQPLSYLAYFDVRNIEAGDGDYDVAAKNIPIVNIFVSKKSKRGQGTPDVGWLVEDEVERLFVSSVANNNRRGYDHSFYLRVFDNDEYNLKVYDVDNFSFNDKIGNCKIVPQNGISVLHLDTSFSGNIKHGNIKVDKSFFPELRYHKSSSIASNYKGLPGISIEIDYMYNKMPNSPGISLSPVIIDNRNISRAISFLRTTNNTEKVSSNSFSLIGNTGKESLFIPLFELDTTSRMFFPIWLDSAKIVLAKNEINIPKDISSKNIFTTNITITENEMIDGVSCIGLSLKNSATDGLYEFCKADEILSSLLFFNKNVEQINMPIFSYNKIDINKIVFQTLPEHKQTWYIPYFMLDKLEGKQTILAKYNVKYQKSQYVLSQYSSELLFNIPHISDLKINTISFIAKKLNKFKKCELEIWHAGILVQTINQEDIQRNMIIKMPDTPFKTHSSDEITIIVKGKNSYDEVIAKSELKVQASQIFSTDYVNLENNKCCKKIKVSNR
jgi:hypothetical protein